MKISERKEILAFLEKLNRLPGGKQAVMFAMNAAGSIPLVGGSIAGISNQQSAKEQNRINEGFLHLAKMTDDDLSNIWEKLNSLLAEPTLASLAILIGEIMDEPFATQVLGPGTQNLYVVLSPATTEELQPYIIKGWISLRSTGSTCSMGTGCSVGNQVEDKKRPYGMGNGFIISVDDLNP